MGSSKPAIIRSVVVLPQPEGPSIEKNSPRSMAKSRLLDRDVAAEALDDVLERDDRVADAGVRRAGGGEAAVAEGRR